LYSNHLLDALQFDPMILALTFAAVAITDSVLARKLPPQTHFLGVHTT